MAQPAPEPVRSRVTLERVRDVRLEARLPTPPMLELLFYAVAVIGGVLLGAAATLIARGAG